MATVKNAERLIRRLALSNFLGTDEGLAITPMLVGKHGIGKSQIIKSAAKHIDGSCYVVEGGSLGEGEITGLPFAFQNADESREVRFVKYYAINKFANLEKFYYEKATTTGFLNGTIKIDLDSEGNEWLINGDEKTMVRSRIDLVEAGDDNKYKFGKELDSKTKLKLLEDGEIKPVFLFIDEINRTEIKNVSL